MVATAVTLNDLEGHSPVAYVFRCNCRTFVQHFTRFQLTVCSHGSSVLAELLVNVYDNQYISGRHFYPNVTTLRSGLCCRNSACLSVVCRLSVTLVHPTQGVEAFGKISSPLCTLAILWPPCKILRRSSQGNRSVGSVKRKRSIKIERFSTYRRLYLMYSMLWLLWPTKFCVLCKTLLVISLSKKF